MVKRSIPLSALFLMLASCAPALQTFTHTPAFTATSVLTETARPTPVFTTTPEFSASTALSTSPTPDLYYLYTNEYLRSRLYGGGEIEFVEVLGQNVFFTRYLIRYPSDGLTIYGFADIPNDEGSHPVIIALHGYIDPAVYTNAGLHHALRRRAFDRRVHRPAPEPARLPALGRRRKSLPGGHGGRCVEPDRDRQDTKRWR